MLRCQVIISSGLLEKNSRSTSESGNIAPNVERPSRELLLLHVGRREQIAAAKSSFAD